MQTVSSASSSNSALVRPVRNAQAWYGSEQKSRTDWIHQASDTERDEVHSALSSARAKGYDLLSLQQSDFPLKQLARTLSAIRRDVLDGRGFALLRGIPIEGCSIEDVALIYRGIGTYLGDAVSQNAKGHVLGHVKNLGLDYDDPEVRGYQTNARLPYHTDFSDVVGLLCLKRSQAGGLSSIVSSTTIWNELVAGRPDLARVLTRPLWYSRWGEIPEGKRRYGGVPVFMPWDGRMIAFYVRSAIAKAQRFDEVPRLTALQIEAMDAVDALARAPRLHLDMEFREGDIQLLCNHHILHSRTSYVDFEDIAERRHLLRLWLACPDGPRLPPEIAELPDSLQRIASNGRPDGIQVPGVALNAPLTAEAGSEV